MKSLRALCVLAFGLCTIAVPPAQSQTSTTKKVWTVSEILAERQEPVDIETPRMCNGGRFKPCVCAPDVTKLVQYRPSIAQCGKKAGIVMSGKYLTAFSVVVRDRENRDRWPIQFPATGRGYGGCTLAQAKTGLARCSAYKVQKIIKVTNENGNAEVHCLGQSGYAPLMKGISRITIKLDDVPGSNADPLERLCLKNATSPLN